MKINILAFGIAKDIIGQSQLTLEVNPGMSVEDLKKQFFTKYAGFNKLNSLLLAVNSEYAEQGQLLKENDEVALIPPVSGG